VNDTTASDCTCPSGDGSLRHPCPIHTIQRAQAQPAAAQEAVEDASNIIELLLTLAYAAWSLADNADGGSGNDNVSVDRRDFDKVSEALDALDELPDDQPGYVMEAAAKARWALRGILASPVAAAPVVPVVPVDSDAFDYLVDEVAAEHGEMLDDGGPSGWSFTCEDLVAFAKRLMSDYKGVLVADAYAIARAEAKRDSTPAAPGIDLEQFRALVEACEDMRAASEECDIGEGLAHAVPFHLWNAFLSKLDAAQQALDASPKGVSTPAPRLELTNGQIAQLHDFAGTPVAGEPLDEQDVLVIQHAEAGHSGPGLYAHYDELPEEGAIYLDGQLQDSAKGGRDALSRAYGYLWHVNHPEDIPTGHPYMSADRAAVEARKELRDMLTHEQRGEGINWVRQKLLADMQATSAEVGA